MIKATIIQDSICNGVRITTFELDYPRFIHSELMTHRMFSRNASSSRAIPIATMNANICDNPAMPVHWGMNQSGMQAKQEVDDATIDTAIFEWNYAKNDAIMHSNRLAKLGLHKQIVNRVTEPFQHMKTVVTMTERSNWYDLRAHEDAQPEIYNLAVDMLKAEVQSEPMYISPGDWHVPYVHREFLEGKLTYSVNDTLITIVEARIISASCCAQVSYRKSDDTLEKAKNIFDRLINSKPQHASPVEHQATPMKYINSTWGDAWELGVTHVDRKCKLWSGNFKGWIQFRQLI